jgi:hypothetical protein
LTGLRHEGSICVLPSSTSRPPPRLFPGVVSPVRAAVLSGCGTEVVMSPRIRPHGRFLGHHDRPRSRRSARRRVEHVRLSDDVSAGGVGEGTGGGVMRAEAKGTLAEDEEERREAQELLERIAKATAGRQSDALTKVFLSSDNDARRELGSSGSCRSTTDSGAVVNATATWTVPVQPTGQNRGGAIASPPVSERGEACSTRLQSL